MSKGIGEVDIEHIKEKLTKHSIIAFDLDKTVLTADPDEELTFILEQIGLLKDLAELGYTLVIITGNKMSEVIKRFFVRFVRELCKFSKLNISILHNIHIFCNGGGVYINFLDEDFEEMLGNLGSNKLLESDLEKLIVESFCMEPDDKELVFKPQFIEEDYIKLTEINQLDLKIINQVLEECKLNYWENFYRNYRNDIYKDYFIVDQDYTSEFELEQLKEVASYLGKFLFFLKNNDREYNYPYVDRREIYYGIGKKACSQVTLKPILSEGYYKGENPPANLRNNLINYIREKFKNNFSLKENYEVKRGGRSSIDISLEKIDKKFALEYIIKKKEVQGIGINDQIGSRTIFLGDEVFDGGNDLVVTDIPGIITFAVNNDKGKIPFRTNIIINKVFTGPTATSDWLLTLRKSTRNLFEKCIKKPTKLNSVLYNNITAIEKYLIDIFRNNIKEMISLVNKINNTELLSVLDATISILLNSTKSEDFIQHLKDYLNHYDLKQKELGFHM